jgi:hypothetical protein
MTGYLKQTIRSKRKYNSKETALIVKKVKILNFSSKLSNGVLKQQESYTISFFLWRNEPVQKISGEKYLSQAKLACSMDLPWLFTP